MAEDDLSANIILNVKQTQTQQSRINCSTIISSQWLEGATECCCTKKTIVSMLMPALYAPLVILGKPSAIAIIQLPIAIIQLPCCITNIIQLPCCITNDISREYVNTSYY